MIRTTTITEVLGRAEQGMTRPFVCSADQWMTCFVKGAYAGQRSMCCEWVANRLVRLALPNAPLGVPTFMMAEVPEALVVGSARSDIRDLGAGKVFASMLIDDGQELTWSAAQGWPEETMALLLLLDLWLQNEDRSLSALGGNPNLLVVQIPPLSDDDPEGALWQDQPRREMLWAYDFNLAFDEDFSRERFFDAHVFGGMLRQWPEGFRERMEPHLQAALAEVRAIFAELPLEWLHVDGDESLPVQLDVERVSSVLSLPFTEPDLFLETAMNSAQAVCNYAILQFLPYPETGEFTNVGVLVNCQQPCLLHFEAEPQMTGRMKAMFPQQNEPAYAAAMAALGKDMERAKSSVRDPKTCQMVFNEIVRRRESLFRFGEVRTILTEDPPGLAEVLFRRFIRMELPSRVSRR